METSEGQKHTCLSGWKIRAKTMPDVRNMSGNDNKVDSTLLSTNTSVNTLSHVLTTMWSSSERKPSLTLNDSCKIIKAKNPLIFFPHPEREIPKHLTQKYTTFLIIVKNFVCLYCNPPRLSVITNFMMRSADAGWRKKVNSTYQTVVSETNKDILII